MVLRTLAPRIDAARLQPMLTLAAKLRRSNDDVTAALAPAVSTRCVTRPHQGRSWHTRTHGASV
jgi:hypothetical protein